MGKKVVFLVIFALLAILLIFLNKSSPSTPQKESLVIKGSDTEVQLVSNLTEAFISKNQNENISVTGGGSGVGIASLLNKEINIANSSRQMTGEEIKLGQSKNLDIHEFILAIDGLSVITNLQNPIKKLSLDQVANIYKGRIANWNALSGKNQPITLYGRQTTSGTYTFFQKFVVKDDYSPNMRNMEGSQAIVDAVKTDTNGIGYVGAGYIKDEGGMPRADINIVFISKDQFSKAVSPLDKEAIKSEEYPITRPIYQYLSALPKKDSLLHRFLIFELSGSGQEIIEKAGFYPLTEKYIMFNQKLLNKIQ